MGHPCPMDQKKTRILVINPYLIDGKNESLKTAEHLMHIQSIGLVLETQYQTQESLLVTMWSPLFSDTPRERMKTTYDPVTNSIKIVLPDGTVETYLSRLPPNGQSAPSPKQKGGPPSKYPTANGRVADTIILNPKKRWSA